MNQFLLTSKGGTSWIAGTCLFLCDLFDDDDDDDAGVCKILANLFCLLLQKFLTSLSVLPGKYVAIFAHLFPNCAWRSITILSSSAENFTPLLNQKQGTTFTYIIIINCFYMHKNTSFHTKSKYHISRIRLHKQKWLEKTRIKLYFSPKFIEFLHIITTSIGINKLNFL